jgi:hypothetical protein
MDRLGRNGAAHQDATRIPAQGAARRVHAEQLGRSPAKPVRRSAGLVDEGQGVLAHRLPFRRGEIPAGRGVLGKALDLVAPVGDGRREV